MDKTHRLDYIDVVAGVMICWMLLRHCIVFSHYSPPAMPKELLAFFMPWFFYKSGAFFKNMSQKDLLIKDIGKYLRYFCVYSLIGWVVWCLCGLYNNELTIKACIKVPFFHFIKFGYIDGNGALWFLLSLFFVRQCANVLTIKKLLSPLVMSIICMALAYTLYQIEWYKQSWWLGNFFSGLCFFLLGYWLKTLEQNNIVFISSLIIYGLVCCACFLGIIEFPYLYMHANKMTCGNYLLYYPTALAGIIVINNLFRLLCKRVRFRILGFIGRNSMYFYVTHWILFTIVAFISKSLLYLESHRLVFLFLLGSSIVFLPLIGRLIDWLKNKNSVLNKIL